MDVVDDEGNPVRVRHVKRDGDWVPCDSELGARKLVANSEGQLLYAGQGLMNQSCARGQCHASGATGELRSGAPAGYDLDLPLAPLVPDPGNAGQLIPDPEVALLLSVHQRRTYDHRDALWKQIETGRMPPGGVGSPYRGAPGLTFVELDDSGDCTSGEEVEGVLESSSKQELAIWLACGAPVVEASDARVTQEVLGKVGNILPACESSGPSIEPTFDNVYAEVLGPACGVTCHFPGGTRPNPASDYSTPQAAYDNLVNAPVDPPCMGAAEFNVVPNDPEASYLLHKMADTELADLNFCDESMPYLSPPLVAGTALIRAWIEAGAPGPGEELPGADAGAAADAGM